jgi:Ca-activated chloride channel homolog
MKRNRSLFGAIVLAAMAVFCLAWADRPALGAGQGTLTVIEPDGKIGEGCPLERTSVKAEVSGFLAHVTVTQIFHNPRKQKIEAVYTFPLSSDAAVNDMTMRVGDRVVRGAIKRKEEARRIYERARDRGNVASLLDQERPNIFTQSVANIMPGEKVEITIEYAEILPYADGSFTFAFPMVVGPRFIPGTPTGKTGTGWAPDTTTVPDASLITPPVAKEGTRAGHDIDLSISIDAGVPILGMESKLHEVEIEHKEKNKASITLKNKTEIPNRDFVLKYLVAGEEIRSGVLTHKVGKEGYVTVIMIPPKRVKPEQIAPKEMIFVIDCSGSQSGKPLQKAKETMKYVIDNMNPDDTFNIIDFNSGARMLFERPKKNTRENRSKAHRYLKSLRARGGTWMGPAVEKICKIPAPENRLRIVTFMTDGYVGNDFQIISMVKRLRGSSRWFPFGTGNSVNRFLLDNMSRVGGGEVEYILLNSPGEKVAEKFYQRIATPVLTDISLDLKELKLREVFPASASDLWDRKPLVFKARYRDAGKGSIIIEGFSGGKPYKQVLNVVLPDKETSNASIASLWARSKVDDLMDRDLMGVQQGKPKKEIKEKIIQVALAHRIMTQFTSFVAVEEAVVTQGGKPVTITVPVEMPDGVSREGVFGDASVVGGMPSPTRQVPTLGYRKVKSAVRRLSSVPQGVAPAKAPALSGPMEAAAGEPMALREESKSVSADKNDEEAAWEKEKREDFKKTAKLAPELQGLADCLRLKGKGGKDLDGRLGVVEGEITVQVWVTKVTDELLEKLKEAGLEISFKAATGKMVIGSIAVEKLEDLAKLSEVRLIEPVKSGKG